MGAALWFLNRRWVEGFLSPRRFSVGFVVRFVVLLQEG